MYNPLVSVVIPVYNAELYLDRCINSVLDQDYENEEIVLVDDGSTDRSSLICSEYADKYPRRIQVVCQQNQGASIARKNGIAASHGEFLMFVDSDDFVSRQYVSALYNGMLNSGADLALCPAKRIEVGESPCFPSRTTSRTMFKKELFHRFFNYEFWGFPGGIYRKDLFGRLQFPLATVNEDYYVKAQMFAAVDFVGYVEEPLYCYEQHLGSLSKQPLSLKALGEFDNAQATWEYFVKHKPEFSIQALAIASEVASKWLGKLNNSDSSSPEIILYKNRIKQFVTSNLIGIIFNPSLSWKVKIVMFYNYFKSLFGDCLKRSIDLKS